MACPHIFKRVLECQSRKVMRGNDSPVILRRKTNEAGVLKHVSQRHKHSDSFSDQLKKINGLMKKAKDTVLVIEATKGPGTKFAYGLAQAAGTAALIFIPGYGLISVNSLVNGSIKKGEDRISTPQDKPVTDGATRKRIGMTYFHMINSLLTSSATAFLSFRLFRNKKMIVKLGEKPVFAIGLGVLTPLVMATLVHYLPRTVPKEGTLIPFGLKELGSLLYAGSIGFLAAPLYLLGGQSIHRAIFITAGTFAGLQGLSHVAPRGSFQSWGKPTAFGINAILLSFALTLLLRRSNPLYNPLFKLMMHGGLVIYSAHFLYASQELKEAARSPFYDPVTTSMALSMDHLSLYGRLAFLLPPHFQLSRKHLFVVPQPYNQQNSPSFSNNFSSNSKNFPSNSNNFPSNSNNFPSNSFKPSSKPNQKNSGNETSSYKPGNDDI